jgi:glutaredoxin-like protein NrdH
MAIQHIQGKKAGNVMIYALSTCPWCKKTKALLDDMGIEYSFEYVDLLTGSERDTVMAEVSRWNSSRSFPTIVINNSKCIVGFKEQDIRDALNKWAITFRLLSKKLRPVFRTWIKTPRLAVTILTLTRLSPESWLKAYRPTKKGMATRIALAD